MPAQRAVLPALVSAPEAVAPGAVESAIAGDLHCPADPTFTNVAAGLHMPETTLRTILANRNVTLPAYCNSPLKRKLNTLGKGRISSTRPPATSQASPDFEYRLSRLGGNQPGFAAQ